jgi:hypothetical protein
VGVCVVVETPMVAHKFFEETTHFPGLLDITHPYAILCVGRESTTPPTEQIEELGNLVQV